MILLIFDIINSIIITNLEIIDKFTIMSLLLFIINLTVISLS